MEGGKRAGKGLNWTAQVPSSLCIGFPEDPAWRNLYHVTVSRGLRTGISMSCLGVGNWTSSANTVKVLSHWDISLAGSEFLVKLFFFLLLAFSFYWFLNLICLFFFFFFGCFYYFAERLMRGSCMLGKFCSYLSLTPVVAVFDKQQSSFGSRI